MGGNSSKSASDSAVEEKKDGVQENQNGGEEVFAETTQNGTDQNIASKRRTSFYETVDASEVLPYLIIGWLV